MNNRKTKININERAKEVLKNNTKEESIYIQYSNGVSGPLDEKTGRVFRIEGSKKYKKKDVRDVFSGNNFFSEKENNLNVKVRENTRSTLNDQTFKDPNKDEWSDWSYDSNSL